jgi:hypothetical protein
MRRWKRLILTYSETEMLCFLLYRWQCYYHYNAEYFFHMSKISMQKQFQQYWNSYAQSVTTKH